MKYANIKYQGGTSINIGDILLLLSIDNLYEYMGIPKSEVQYIDFRNLNNYDGEKVVLPIVSAFMSYQKDDNIFDYSDKIIPVFLSVAIYATYLSKVDIEYLKKYQPIGCRDEHTYNLLHSYCIDAYINGCFTMSLDFSRGVRKVGGTTFWVDLPDELIPLLPDFLKKNLVKRTNQVETQGILDIKKYVIDRYKEYIEKANCVITSRLHCALPCAVASIPVIYICKKKEYRFAWLEKMIPIYTINQCKDLSWEPIINTKIRDIGKEMLRYAANRCKLIMDRENYINKMSNFVTIKAENTVIFSPGEILKKEIQLRNKEKQYKSFAFWGANQLIGDICSWVQDKIADIKFLGIADERKEGFFNGKRIMKPSELENVDLVIVLPLNLASEEKENIRNVLLSKGSDPVFILDYYF